MDKKIYFGFSIFVYFTQIYQNIITCFSFYSNLKKIHRYLFDMRDYIEHTIHTMDSLESQSNNLKQYNHFVSFLKIQREILNQYKQELDKITPWSFNVAKMINIGQSMKCFYLMYTNDELKNAFTYSFGLHGYVDNIKNLQMKYKKKQISYCKFSKTKNIFKDAYFPSLIKSPIKNSYNLNKHLLITGPNAAGKTTMIKTTFFNILFSQQTCFGFYSKATITPFNHLHCYLNIPDTSGRDSLFQAEARRCKDILDAIDKSKCSKNNDRHFCIFDELYSGTNPYEAISSAIAFLKYLNGHTNVKYILTTHFLDLCKKLDSESNVKNCHMDVDDSIEDFKYTYKIVDGISNIKGGVKVLRELEYPEEIIQTAKQLIREVHV
jgi:DNA mismatch repair ATPase MutS